MAVDDTKSGYPFWAVKNGLMAAFPQLAKAVSCDVAVIGGGITGAIIADELSRHGHEVVVVEQRDIAWGSTAASTALLQYEIDTHLVDLAKQYGEQPAVLAYTSCAEAVMQLGTLAREVKDVGFARSDSLYLASKRKHAPVFAEEHALRVRHGLPSKLLSAAEVRDRYDTDAPAALLTELAAVVDPYRFTCRLLARIARRGVRVFDRTQITNVKASSRGVALTTSDGVSLRCRFVIVAGGYQSQSWLSKRVAKNRSSYACISDPLDAKLLGALATTMVWESARPYLYVRSTGEGRVLVGGLDDPIDIPAKRDARVHKRARELLSRVREKWPRLDVKSTFAWAGTFAETEDGLPFFGAHAQHGPRVLFAMAYGGNGITYSMLGAGLLRATIERREHPLMRLFAFDRVA